MVEVYAEGGKWGVITRFEASVINNGLGIPTTY